MNRRTLIKTFALSTVVLAMSNGQSLAAFSGTDRKRQVLDLLKSIETGEPGPGAIINPNHYTQHNLSVSDGLAGFGAVLQQLPARSARVNTVRVFEDGDYVFAHTDYNFFGPKIGFDIFRFEDGRIVEHWDNLQDTPSQPNPSGRTMIDGASEIADLDKTDTNKAVVKGFVDEVLSQRRLERAQAYVDPATYLQHNPHAGDGVEAMIASFRKLDASGSPHRYFRIHKLLGEGNFVLAVSEGVAGDTPTAFYDLFRLADGRIVEHWDVLQTIPPRSEWKNDNGKF